MHPTRTHRPLTAGRKAGIILLALASLLLLLPTADEARAQQSIIPGVPLGEIDLPPLPATADLSSLLGLLPLGLDLNRLDLLKGQGGTNGLSQLLGALPINLFSPTFKITDEPGSWFDSGLTLFGGKSLAPVLKLPGIQTKATFIVSPETGADTNHSITSLIRPVGAPLMDQPAGFVGTREYEFTEPGLYAFTCKIHPYMLGAAVVDDPLTVGLDFGKKSIVNMYDGATVVPTFSDIIFRLVRTFFTATVPSNWQTFSSTTPVTWDPSYPAAPILTYKANGLPALLPTLDGFFQKYFNEPKILPPANLKPAIPGVGEVWIDTQFEKTAGKTKPGTATAVDVENWTVAKKVALPGINMNNPHNMWTDKDQRFIYQTEWFSDQLDVFDRETLQLLRRVQVGNAPSHVMTRTDTDQLHVALNGANAVVELAPYAAKIDRRLLAQREGEPVAHPHAHWMSADGQLMVAPDPNTDEATLWDVPSGKIIQKPRLSRLPIASSMTPDSSKYYVANLLANSISCVSIDVTRPACVDNGVPVIRKTIRLDTNYDLVTGAHGDIGLLPIQLPVSPDGKYLLSANTMSGTVAVVDVGTDTVIKTLPCDPGCHGINFGAKAGGGYYGYLSNKFSNTLMVIDGDPNGDGNASDAAIVGKMVLDPAPTTRADDGVVKYAGMGGQGVLAVPLVYNGWVQKLPPAWSARLTCKQRNPIGPPC